MNATSVDGGNSVSVTLPPNAALANALEHARSAFRVANPASEKQYQHATTAMPGGNTRSVLYYDPFPIAIARGEGCRLWDADGHEYIDFIGEFSAGIYGHSHPVIRAAIDHALDGGINLSGHNLLETKLAHAICARFPAIESVRFTNSGTEANLVMLAAATAFTKKRKIIVFVGGYHGGVLTFANGSNPVNVPHDFLYAEYNDLNAVSALFDENKSDIAAVLVEPMQGASGCIVGAPDFLNGLRDLTHRHDALLMFDEVMTSRLSGGGLHGQYGIRPDLVSLGKYIGGGMSFGAFGGRSDIMAQFDPRAPGALPHAGTFNNNVMTMSAGFAGITSLYTAEAAQRLSEAGDSMRTQLNAVFESEKIAMRFIGIGSLMNLQITDRPIRSVRDINGELNPFKDLFFFHMLSKGIYLAKRGYVVLSLPITSDDIACFKAGVRSFIAQYGPCLPKSM